MMKNSLLWVLILLTAAVVCGAAPDTAGDKDPDRKSMTIKASIEDGPNYFLNAREDPYYNRVFVYNRDADKARTLFVSKSLVDFPLAQMAYIYKGGSLLSVVEKKLDTLQKELPSTEKRVLNKDFQYTRYDAKKYAGLVSAEPELGVIRCKGKIIWYRNDNTVPDAALLPDGRFLVATADSAFYISEEDGRLIAEVYSKTHEYLPDVVSEEYRSGSPAIRILTDNIVRKSYPNGCVEHWKIRLSRKDVDENNKKYRKADDGRGGIWFNQVSANRSLIWCNDGRLAGSPARTWPQTDDHSKANMWCYREGGTEPAAESYADMSFAKTVSADSAAYAARKAAVPAAEPEQTEAGSAEAQTAQTGWLAGLVLRIKSFLAGLFA